MNNRLKKLDSSLEPNMEAGTRGVLLVALAGAAILCAVYQFQALNYRYPLDYGEAPLIDQALRLVRGEGLYRASLSAPPYIISNYPPLYITLLAPFMAVFGPNFFVGRLISILCAWLSAILIGLIVHRITRDQVAGFIAGGTFLAFPFVMMWSSLGRIDLLAMVLSLGGLFVLVRQPMTHRILITGAVLLVAAIYTRQTYALAAPLAACLWLLLREEFKQAGKLAGLVIGLSGGLFLLLNLITQGGFYFNIVTANMNDWSGDTLTYSLQRFGATASVLCGVGLLSVVLGERRNPMATLGTPYLLGAIATFATIGKIGSNVNYMLELCAALCLATGGIIAWLRGTPSADVELARQQGIPLKASPKPPAPLVRVVILALLVIQAFSMILDTTQREYPDLETRLNANADLIKLENVVAANNGPVLADEYMGLLTLQGRALTMQPFEVTQLSNAHLWDEAALVKAINDKTFPLILIHYFPNFPVYKTRWSPGMLDAIYGSYQLSQTLANTGVYVPLGPAPTVPATPAQCQGAPWRLPTNALTGVLWQRSADTLYFLGPTQGQTPVYAVADGLVTRLHFSPNSPDLIAIQHDDPLKPGDKMWSLYSEMGPPSGKQSFVAPEFPMGSKNKPVKAGQLIGYQGQYSDEVKPLGPHVLFGLLRGNGTDGVPTDWGSSQWVDPTPYVGLGIQPFAQNREVQLLACAK